MTSSPDENTLLSISITLAKQGQILDELRRNSEEIKDDIRSLRDDLKEYMPRSEAKLQFEAFTASLTALQVHVKQLLDWQLAETRRTGDSVIATNDKIEKTKDSIGDTKEQGNKLMMGIQGTALAIAVSLLLWILENYIAHH